MQVDRETLTKINGSLLTATFSGNVELKKDENERIFLDRDPEIFRQVIQMIRNDLQPKDLKDVDKCKLS